MDRKLQTMQAGILRDFWWPLLYMYSDVFLSCWKVWGEPLPLGLLGMTCHWRPLLYDPNLDQPEPLLLDPFYTFLVLINFAGLCYTMHTKWPQQTQLMMHAYMKAADHLIAPPFNWPQYDYMLLHFRVTTQLHIAFLHPTHINWVHPWVSINLANIMNQFLIDLGFGCLIFPSILLTIFIDFRLIANWAMWVAQ